MESMSSGDNLLQSAAAPAANPALVAGKDSTLIKLLHIALTINDTPQTGIDTTFRIATHHVSNKGGLLAYMSQLICWDLDNRVLPQGQSCVVAAALVNDHGPRFVIGINTHDDLSLLHEPILKTLPRAIAGVPADHVVDKYYPLPTNGAPFRIHAEQQIATYVRAVYGRAVRRTMGAIGIAHVHGPCTPTAGAGIDVCCAYFARKCLKAIKSAANADLNIQPFWYKHGQRPPRELCSPEYLIKAGIEYERDGH